MEGAWRARQRAELSIGVINEFFQKCLAIYNDADLQVGGHDEMV
jgi:hypothetical protein